MADGQWGAAGARRADCAGAVLDRRRLDDRRPAVEAWRATCEAKCLARPTVAGDFHGQAALLWFAAELARADR